MKIRYNLKYSIKKQDRQRLPPAVDDFKKAKLPDDDQDLPKADRVMKLFQAADGRTYRILLMLWYFSYRQLPYKQCALFVLPLFERTMLVFAQLCTKNVFVAREIIKIFGEVVLFRNKAKLFHANMRDCGKQGKMRDFLHDCGTVDTYDHDV